MLKRRLIPFLAIAVAAIQFGAQERTGAAPASDSQILHALQRMTFGPRPGDMEAVRRTGLQNWIQQQLHPESITENPVLLEQLKPLASLQMNLVDSAANSNYGRPAIVGNVLGVLVTGLGEIQVIANANGGASIQRNMMVPVRSLETDLKDGKVYRALYSNRQLEEVLVDFWFNHFNVTAAKGGPFVADYEREAIRPYVLGKFKDMLVATALHPAMLQYLDNKASIAPKAAQPNGPNMTFSFGGAKGLNENFSRELMELHTMGVNGGYTQKDIEAAARCFTGWNLVQTPANTTTREPGRVEYAFVEWPHDYDDKVVLGHTIKGSGQDEVYELLDLLATHPSTARHISRRLAQRFVADEPPQALVDRMTKTFRETDGDLRAVMTTMLTSPEFLSEKAGQSKIKSPLELVISSLRILNAEVSEPAPLEQWIADMGQPLYGKIEPTGYPNTGEDWLSTSRLLTRLNFATSLTSGKIKGVTWDSSNWNGKDTGTITRSILLREPSPQTIEALRNGNVAGDVTAEFIGGLILGSPDFQRR